MSGQVFLLKSKLLKAITEEKLRKKTKNSLALGKSEVTGVI